MNATKEAAPSFAQRIKRIRRGPLTHVAEITLPIHVGTLLNALAKSQHRTVAGLCRVIYDQAIADNRSNR